MIPGCKTFVCRRTNYNNRHVGVTLMSGRLDCPAIFPMSVILAVFCFTVCWSVADIADPGWVFGSNMLSDMGCSHVRVTEVTFNASCICCGLVLMAFGMSKVMFGRGVTAYSGFFLAPAGFLLSAVGVVPSDYIHWLHLSVAYGFALCAATYILMSLSECWRTNRFVCGAFGSAFLIVCIGSFFSGSAALAETWLVILFMIWMLLDAAMVVVSDFFGKSRHA